MRTLSIALSCLAIGTSGLSAYAQGDKPATKPAGQPPAAGQPGDRPARGGGGGGMRQQPLSPEQQKAAWDLQVASVAKSASLNEAQTKAVATAYAAARESHNAATEKMRKEMRDAADNGGGGGGNPGDMRQKMQDLNKAETEKFQKSLGSTLSAEQTTKVVALLGNFNPTWDRGVSAVAELKLDAKKQGEALAAVQDYITAQNKVRADAAADPQAGREAMHAAREKFHTALAAILTEEQAAKVEGAFGGGRGRGAPGGPGGDQPQRRRQRDGGNDGGKDGGGK